MRVSACAAPGHGGAARRGDASTRPTGPRLLAAVPTCSSWPRRFTRETRALLGRAEFALLPRGAVLVNVARAQMVDTAALSRRWRPGTSPARRSTSFPQEPLPPEHPLWTRPNVIITPHTSGFRQGHWDEVVDLFVDNLDAATAGRAVAVTGRPALGY